MSKKKATMTLKDFHGGSIPSDLPLPSAPGVIVRPGDRVGFDQQMPWGNSVGRSDHRLHPASAGSGSSARNLDDKTPFLGHSSHIGRHFDEDERKPLEGLSSPHRMVSDDSIIAQPNHMVEPKIDNSSGARVGIRTTSLHAPKISSASAASSYAGSLHEVHNAAVINQNLSGSRIYGSSSPNMGGNVRKAAPVSYPNAWGARMEITSVNEPVTTVWSAPEAATKLAHASALEKVSSGRWNSKQRLHPQKDAEVFQHPETDWKFQHNVESTNNKNNYSRLNMVGNIDYHDVNLTMHAQRSLSIDDGICSGGKELPPYERGKSAHRIEPYQSSPSIAANGFRLPHPAGRSGGTESQSMPSELSERPKLNLLPRSKPLGNLETSVYSKGGYQQTSDIHHVEDSYGLSEPVNPVQSGFTASVVTDRAPEHPKLNLKPRSQPLAQLEENIEVKRGIVYGGARPREVILKDRGIGDDVSNFDSQPLMRGKDDVLKADTSMRVPPAFYNEKAENISGDQRAAKYADSRDHRIDGEKVESQRKNRQIETWRNNEKQLSQQLKDRPPSPGTWRKPVEHVKPASPDAPTPRHGKAASAVELAQAFSKSISDPALADRASEPRGLPSRSPIPFSRLTGPTPRPRINGY